MVRQKTTEREQNRREGEGEGEGEKTALRVEGGEGSFRLVVPPEEGAISRPFAACLRLVSETHILTRYSSAPLA